MRNNPFECDRKAKEVAVNYFTNLAKKDGWKIDVDYDYMFNAPKARTDIKFTISKDDKIVNYDIELKERSASTINSYPDDMFEEDKLDVLVAKNKQGVKTYFLNVFKNYYAMFYPIDEHTKFQTGMSWQYPETVQYCDHKEWIPKIFINRKYGKYINLNDD